MNSSLKMFRSEVARNEPNTLFPCHIYNVTRFFVSSNELVVQKPIFLTFFAFFAFINFCRFILDHFFQSLKQYRDMEHFDPDVFSLIVQYCMYFLMQEYM